MHESTQPPEDNVSPEQPQEQLHRNIVTLELNHESSEDLPARLALTPTASAIVTATISSLLTSAEGEEPWATIIPGPPEGGLRWPAMQRREHTYALVSGIVVGQFRITKTSSDNSLGLQYGFSARIKVESAGHFISLLWFMTNGNELERQCRSIVEAGEVKAFGILSVDCVEPHVVALFVEWWEPIGPAAGDLC